VVLSVASDRLRMDFYTRRKAGTFSSTIDLNAEAPDVREHTEIIDLDFSPDGRFLVSCSYDRTVYGSIDDMLV